MWNLDDYSMLSPNDDNFPIRTSPHDESELFRHLESHTIQIVVTRSRGDEISVNYDAIDFKYFFFFIRYMCTLE